MGPTTPGVEDNDSFDPTFAALSLKAKVGLPLARGAWIDLDKLPVGDFPSTEGAGGGGVDFPNDVVGLCDFLIASILLSAFSFLLYSSIIVALRPSTCCCRRSSASEDFCRSSAKSLGFMFLSSELEGLSAPSDFRPLLVFGTIGGSTGAARRIFFGGGLLQKRRFRLFQSDHRQGFVFSPL